MEKRLKVADKMSRAHSYKFYPTGECFKDAKTVGIFFSQSLDFVNDNFLWLYYYSELWNKHNKECRPKPLNSSVYPHCKPFTV